MQKWIGNEDTIESFRRRAKENIQNIDDLIRYLEYTKNTGYQAARVPIIQEEHWACLLRDIMVKELVKDINIENFSSNGSITIGSFICVKCEKKVYFRVLHEEGGKFEIMKYCGCEEIIRREDDIMEYLMRDY